MLLRTTICFFFLSLCIRIHSQNYDYIVAHYGENSMIQSGGIQDVMFDRSGLLWMATQMGITRFDGKFFKKYNRLTNPDFSCNRFVSITKRNYFLGDDNSFYEVNRENNVPKHLKHPGIAFLNYVFEDSLKAKAFDQKISNQFGSGILRIRTENRLNSSFYPVNRKQAFLVVKHKLYAVTNKKIRLISESEMHHSKRQLLGKYIAWKIHEDKKIILESFHGKVDFRSILFGEINLQEVNVQRTHLFHTRSGADFLIVGDQLFKLIPKGGRFYAKLIFNRLTISDLSCMDYHPERKIYAFGSASKGLYILRENHFHSIGVSREFHESITYATIPWSHDEILMSNGSLYDVRTGRMKKLLEIEDNVRAFLKDSKGGLWFAQEKILHRYDRKKKSVRKWDIRTITPDVGVVQKIWEDSKGVIWFNTARGIYSIKDGRFVKKGITFKPKSTYQEYIESFYFLSENEVWIGTNNRLITRNIATNTTRELLTNMDIRCIYKDREGDIWIGSYGNGFFLYRKGKIYRGPLDDHHFLICAHTFLLDKKRNVWISSNKGIFTISKEELLKAIRFKQEQLDYIWLSTLDGLSGNEFNGGCFPVSYASGNRFYFPSMTGLISFSPDILQVNNRIYGITVNSMECDGRLLKKDPVTLSPDFNRFTIDFTIPYWGNYHNLHTSYRLQKTGSEKSIWQNLNPGEQIRISNLSYGDYMLVIRVKNRLGGALNTYKRIPFRVTPFFYQTLFFRISIVFMVLTVLAGLYLLRMRFLIRERKLLKKKVAVQVQELFNANKELELALGQLNVMNEKLEHSNNIRAKLVSIFIHDLKSPMRFLALVTKKMYQKTDLLSQEEVREMSGDLYNYSMAVMQYIDHFLVWQSINQDNWEIKKVKVHVAGLLHEVASSYYDICRKNGNEIQIRCSPDLSLFVDVDLLCIVIRNLVDNANKHTYSGTIELSVTDHKKTLSIHIKDSGKGLSPEEITLIHTYMNQSNFGKTHMHIGYQIVGDFLKAMQATITIRSEGDGKGTEIRMVFPK